MTLEAPAAPAEPERAYQTEYTVLVLDELSTVLNDAYPHPSARRDAVVDLLLANHDEVDPTEVIEILEPFGGANADSALNDVVNLFVERGVGITVTIGTRERDLGPQTIYTAFTDYGNGSYWVEHYPTRVARLEELRQRALSLDAVGSKNSFEDADEDACLRVIDGALAATNGRVILIEAIRHSVDESWAGQFPDEGGL